MLNFLFNSGDVENEAEIRKKKIQIKDDKTSIVLKVKRNVKISLTSQFKSELAQFIKVESFFTKTPEDGSVLDESGLEGVGRDFDSE